MAFRELRFVGHLQVALEGTAGQCQCGKMVRPTDALPKQVLTHDRMLFEFHQAQNAKKPNSIHATYLISGTKQSDEGTANTNGRIGEDVSMRSSPFMSSMPEQEQEDEEQPVRKTTLSLVREEELESESRAQNWTSYANKMMQRHAQSSPK